MKERTSAASSPSTERPVRRFERYLLDRNVKRVAGGRILLGGEPGRLFRLSPVGADTLDRLLASDYRVGPPSATSLQGDVLVDRLLTAGVVHPLPSAEEEASLGEITVVVPVKNPPPSFPELLGALVSTGVKEVVVVDDGSDDTGSVGRTAADSGARLVRRDSSGGPALARNAGDPSTSLVAYLDADTVLDGADPAGWLWRCASHFLDPRVGAVAPRVVGRPRSEAHPSELEAYEELESSLDLGPEPGLVGSGRRLSYVPAAALVARVSALVAIGGFDEQLRHGEDVDLVRRLEAAGWWVRYEPGVHVGHLSRSGLLAFVRQRIGYGTAAAALQKRHPGSVPTYVATPAGALSATGFLVWLVTRSARRGRHNAAHELGRLALLAAAGGVIAPVPRLSSKLADGGCPRATVIALEFSARASSSAVAGAFAGLRRVWWPFLLPAIAHRRTLRPAATLLLVAFAAGHGRAALRSARRVDPPRRIRRFFSHLAIGLADDLAYGSGVWLGCLREGSFASLGGRIGSDRGRGPIELS